MKPTGDRIGDSGGPKYREAKLIRQDNQQATAVGPMHEINKRVKDLLKMETALIVLYWSEADASGKRVVERAYMRFFNLSNQQGTPIRSSSYLK